MTSIVIPLGNGSRWSDTELRYCLRSITKHLAGYGDIFIVGEKPEWLKGVVHIPCPDYGDKTYHKERNIFEKIMAACKDNRVTEDFLFMNDDHFLLQDFEAGKFPYYCHGWLSEFLTVTDYKHTVKNTIEALADKGLYNLYWDIHCPIVYNKRFVTTLSRLDWSIKFGYCIKTLYCERWVNEGAGIDDLKINEIHSSDQIRKLIAGRRWFSIGDKAREGGLLRVLNELYPKKSPYET